MPLRRLQELQASLDRARWELADAESKGNGPQRESGTYAVRTATRAILMHCEREDLPLPPDLKV
jgi:hypothetical protein